MNITPEKAMKTLYHKIRPEWKLSFLATFVIGFAAYFFKFLNNLPNWDTLMDYYYPTNNMLHQGRQFQVIACAFGSFVDTPWITGILCLLYIAIATVLILELLKIRSRSGIFLISGLLVTFPTFISSFAYMYMADAFAVAFLCSTIAVYVTQRYKKGWISGALVLGFGIGVYQGFLSCAVALILVWIMREMLFEETDWKQFRKAIVRFLLMGILAMVFYSVSLKICIAIEQIPLDGHQGMGSMGMPDLIQILAGIKNSYLDTLYFYTGSLHKVSLYQVLNILLLICGLIYTVKAVGKMKFSEKGCRIAVFLLCVCVYPCVCYIYYFVTKEISYHTLMIMPLSLIYVYIIMLYEQNHDEQKENRDIRTERSLPQKKVMLSWFRLLPLVFCGLLVYNNAVTANISYRIMNESFEKTLNTMTRIVDRVEQLEEFDGIQKLAVFGELPDSDSSSVMLGTDIVGITEGQMISHQLHMVAMLDEYYHIQLTGCTEDELSELKNSDEYQSIGIWPQEGSVAVSEDTLLIRFE